MCRVMRPYLLDRAHLPASGTAILFAVPYVVRSDVDDDRRNVSLYAVPEDYHLYVRELGDTLLPFLANRFPEHRFALFSDHSPIAEVDAAGQAWIIDATIKYGVDRHPLDTFLTQFTLKDGSLPVFEVMRLKDDSQAAKDVARAKQYVGMPYDVAFLPDNDALYCTELVQLSYLSESGEQVFASAPMNFKNAEGEFPLYWTQLFELIHQPIPQGIPGTNPQAMSRDPQLRSVSVTIP
jgi:hypothetical protein